MAEPKFWGDMVTETTTDPIDGTVTYWFWNKDQTRRFSLDVYRHQDEYSDTVTFTLQEWHEDQMAPTIRSVRHCSNDKEKVQIMEENMVKEYYLDTFPVQTD